MQHFFSHGETKINPPVANDDIHMPMENIRSGSKQAEHQPNTTKLFALSKSRPRANATADIAAIIDARRTEGSARVITTNQPSRNRVSPSRHHVRARLMYEPNTANTNATF
jgi:hypothetical protein